MKVILLNERVAEIDSLQDFAQYISAQCDKVMIGCLSSEELLMNMYIISKALHYRQVEHFNSMAEEQILYVSIKDKTILMHETEDSDVVFNVYDYVLKDKKFMVDMAEK